MKKRREDGRELFVPDITVKKAGNGLTPLLRVRKKTEYLRYPIMIILHFTQNISIPQ